jgi:protein gp37
MSKTKIEWAGKVWNPSVGCSKISDGCRECYAEKMANRLTGILGKVGTGENLESWAAYSYVITKGKWNGRTAFIKPALFKPYHWKNPSMIFVCSMSDLFHENTPFERIYRVFEVIRTERRHIFMVLTKRPERMAEFIEWYGEQPMDVCLGAKVNSVVNGWPFENLWIGVTAENQAMADKRIPLLMRIPASRRFLSIEPMLGQIDITNKGIKNGYSVPTAYTDSGIGVEWTDPGDKFIGVNWVICGAESGEMVSRRDMDMEWAISLKNQCVEAGVPFFFKQAYINGKRVSMPKLDGEIWDQIPKIQ